MDSFPDEINEHIISIFINNYKYLFSIIQLNHYYHKMTIIKYKNALGNLRYITQNIPRYIINLFNHISDVGELPVINLTEDFRNLKLDEVSKPIMRGVDILGKKFITFKICFEAKNENYKRREVVISLYQKYMCYYSSISHWRFFYESNDASRFFVLTNNSTLNITSLNNYKRLINGEKLKISDHIIYLNI